MDVTPDTPAHIKEIFVTDGGVHKGESQIRTSSVLLEKIKARDQEAWQRFVNLYGPLISHWCRLSGLDEEDVADVGQEVFRTVSTSIDGFQQDGKEGSFHRWLRTVTRTRILDYVEKKCRQTEGTGGSDGQAAMLRVPDTLEDSNLSDEDDKLILVRRATDLILDSCKVENRQAFLRVVIGGEDPKEVAKDLNVSVNSIYLAKSHILRRIREEFSELFGF